MNITQNQPIKNQYKLKNTKLITFKMCEMLIVITIFTNIKIREMIKFRNLTEQENLVANQRLEDLRNYLDTIEKNNSKFNEFFNLFNKLCQERGFDPAQLKMF